MLKGPHCQLKDWWAALSQPSLLRQNRCRSRVERGRNGDRGATGGPNINYYEPPSAFQSSMDLVESLDHSETCLPLQQSLLKWICDGK